MEQLRAYDFEEQQPTTIEASFPIFFKSVDGLVGDTEEVVIIQEIENANVDAIKNGLEQAVIELENHVSESTLFDNRRGYLLLVPPTVTKAMRIAAKRGAGKRSIGNNEAFILPIIADLENVQVVYKSPSTLDRVGSHGKMTRRVPKYFKL